MNDAERELKALAEKADRYWIGAPEWNDFAAAAMPKTILALLARCEKLEAALRAYMSQPIGPLDPSDARFVMVDWTAIYNQAQAALRDDAGGA